MGNLTGRVALVTGGARRLGAAIVRELHGGGMRVLIHYRRSADAAASLLAELDAARPGDAELAAADLADPAAPAALVRAAVERFGRLDLLVNNASVFYPTPLSGLTRESWRETLAANLEAPVFLAQAAAPVLAEYGGAIVNVTDAGLVPAPGRYAAYVAAKAGLAALTGAFARELAPAVRVNAVAPGAILWPEPEPDAADKERVLASIPLGRLGAVADVARTVAWLAGEPYLTGVTLPVDGGRSVANPGG